MNNQQCIGFVKIAQYQNASIQKRNGYFEPYTTGELLNDPEHWMPVCRFDLKPAPPEPKAGKINIAVRGKEVTVYMSKDEMMPLVISSLYQKIFDLLICRGFTIKFVPKQ